jgi:hypothetical protein
MNRCSGIVNAAMDASAPYQVHTRGPEDLRTPVPELQADIVAAMRLTKNYRMLHTDYDTLRPVGEDRIGVVVRGSGPGNGEVPCDLILHARSELEE